MANTKLLAVISPAKLMDDQSHYSDLECTQPTYLKEAAGLSKKLAKLSIAELTELMDMSATLAEQTKKRYTDWKTPFTHANAHPAILLFKGEVYRGLQAESLSKKELHFAQDHLRILSGLYGVLRPLDLALPYRLMMGTAFAPDSKNKNLYQFWSHKITEDLKQTLQPGGTLINLASDEYFKVIDRKHLERKVIHCEFKEKKDKDYKVVGTYAKLARGMMAGFIIRHKIDKTEHLKAFDLGGYKYQKSLSTEDSWVFAR